MRIELLALLLTCMLTSIVSAQPTIGDQVWVDKAELLSHQSSETSAASSHLNPQVVVAAWNNTIVTPSVSGAILAAISSDGGSSWDVFPIPNVPPVSGDPMTAADPRTGTLWVGGAAFGAQRSIWLAKWNGIGFDPAVVIPAANADKPFMAIGPRPNDTSHSRMYVVYYNLQQYIIWADYDDATGALGPFSAPVVLSPPPGTTNVDGPIPRVGPNGELFVLFGEHVGFGVWLYRSDNWPTQPFGPAVSVAQRLDTWTYNTTNEPRVPGFFRVPARNCLAVDPVDGTLYCAYFDTTAQKQINGLPNYDLDIYLTISKPATPGAMAGDPGSWDTPHVVNIADPVPYDQFFPWIEVDQQHRVHMVFYDTLGTVHTDQDTPAYLRARYAYSLDSGANWVEQTIAPLWGTGPPPPPAFADGMFTPPGAPNVGDYNGMALAGNRVYPVYMATLGQDNPTNPNQDIYTNVIVWP